MTHTPSHHNNYLCVFIMLFFFNVKWNISIFYGHSLLVNGMQRKTVRLPFGCTCEA